MLRRNIEQLSSRRKNKGMTSGYLWLLVFGLAFLGGLFSADRAWAGCDDIAPTTPTNVSATPATGSIVLNWTASYDSVGVFYRILRCTGATCSPSGGVIGGTGGAPTYTDTQVVNGTTYGYVIYADDFCGWYGSPNSSPVAYATVSGTDTTPPTINSITSVAGDTSAPYFDATNDSSTVVAFTSSADTATCKWNAADGAYDSMANTCTSPSSCTLNLAGNGAKTVYLRCVDAIGNKATSSYALNYVIDSLVPVVTALTLPTTAPSNPFPITTLTGTDNVGVTAWMIKEMGASTPVPSTPLAGDAGWNPITVTTPANVTGTVTATTGGQRYFWAYLKDDAGNVSVASAIQTVTIPAYTITLPAPTNGSISPAGPITDFIGAVKTFTVTPNTGYVASVGGTCGGNLVGTTYTTNPITTNCTVVANFYSNTGMYTSAIKEFAGTPAPTYGAMAWTGTPLPAGTTRQMLVRTGTTPDGSGTSWSVWSDACNITADSSTPNTPSAGITTYTKNSIASGCVDNGEQYVQYRVVLTTTNTDIADLMSVTINTATSFSQTFLNLISSPFDTGSANSTVQKITWSSSNDANNAVGFQIRTSSDNTTWGAWCGPSACGTANNINSFATGTDTQAYYTDKNGATTINATSGQTGTSGNKWIQYATFLKSPDSGVTTPTLSAVTMQYSYNVPPTIPIISQSSQSTDGNGVITVPYTLREVRDDFGNISRGYAGAPIYASLFYQPDGAITLGTNLAADTATGTQLTLNNIPAGTPIPTIGTMLVNGELIDFNAGDGVNKITVLKRGASFNNPETITFKTDPIAHQATSNEKVYFMAKNLSGGAQYQSIASLIQSVPASPGANADAPSTFTWNAKTEPNIALNGKKLANMSFRVVAHDGNDTGFNAVGQSADITVQTLDLQGPTVSGITNPSISQTTYYSYYGTNKSATINVKFSENITSSGVTLTLNNGKTTVNGSCPDIISSNQTDTIICTYSLGSADSDSNPLGITSINGTITDKFSNAANATIGSGKNLSDQTYKTIVDNTAPTAAITYSLNRNVKPGETQRITATFNEPMADAPIPKIAITGSNTLGAANMNKTDTTHYYYDHIVGAGNGTATVALSIGTDIATNLINPVLTSGSTFTIDNIAPTAAVTYSLNRNVKSGEIQTITATFNEVMADAPIPKIAISGANTVAATNMTKVDTTHYTYAHTVGAGNGTATIALSIGTDSATNVITATPTGGATFTVDNMPPTATITYSLNRNVKSGEIQTITATFNEVMADAPIPKIAISGANTVAATNMTKVDTTHYTYAHTVGAGNGTATVALGIGTDSATNVITATPTGGATFTVDNMPPTATITYSLNRNVKSGEIQTITATFNEVMADAPIPKIAISGANTVAATNMTKVDTTHYTYNHTVGAGNGTATIALSTGTDTATNVITAAPTGGASFTVDNLAPTFTMQYYSDVALVNSLGDNPKLKAGTYYVKISASEALTAVPTISIDAEGTANDVTNAATTLVSGNDYKYARVVATDGAAIGTAIEDFSVSGTDNAGNGAVATNPTNEAAAAGYTDTAAPTVANTLTASNNPFSPNADTIKDTTNFSFVSSETGTYTIVVTEIGGTGKTATLSGTMFVGIAKTHTWDGRNGATQLFVDGTHSAVLTITDQAGNVTTSASLNVIIDVMAPTGTIAINGGAVFTNSADVTLTLSANDATSGVSEMQFSNDNATWSGWETFATTKTWTVAIPGTDGMKTVYMQIRDNAGNVMSTEIADIINLDTQDPVITFGTDSVNLAPSQNDHVDATITDANLTAATYGFASTCNSATTGLTEITGVTGSDATRNLAIDVNTEAHNGSKLCIKAIDGSGRTSYIASANAFNIDVTAPVITFSDDVVAGPVQSDTVAITTSDANADTNAYKYILADDNSCNNKDYGAATAFVSGEQISLSPFNTIDYNGKFICAEATDKAGNTQHQASANPINIDVVGPNIDVTFNVDMVNAPKQSATATITVVDPNLDTASMAYIYSSSSDCKQQDYAGATAFTTTPKTVDLTDESQNGKYICVKAADTASNISYQASSNPIHIDVTKPTLTFTDDVDTGPTMSDTITVTETEKNADLLKYAISEDNVCDDTDPRFDFTSVADLGNDQRSATVTFSEELRGKTFCVLATDQAENVSTYLKGAEVLNIDRTVPTAISFTTNSPVSDLNNPATVYGNGEQINIQAIFDEELQDGASLSVKLNNTAKDEVVLNNLDATKKILSGTYTVIQGATHDTSALAVSAFAITPDKELKDIAGNTFVQTDFPADNFNGKLIVVDTEPPSLESFSATIDGQVSGSFKAGKVITVTASYSENLSAGSNAHVKINIAGATDIPLTAISANTLHGTYTILDGDNAANLENLKITSIISQDAIDIINNHLTTVTEIAVGSYVPVVTNIPDGLRIDTTPPSNATITINSGASESKDNLVSLALATDDNFSDLSGMQLELSNDGIAWCDATGIVNQKSAYATTVADWNLTNTVCGTQSAPNAQDKIDAKVFVRFTDGATNPGSSANDTIVFDGVPPRITDISAQFELAKIYGPDMEIPVTVTFSEPLHPTKEIAMTVNFANGGKATDFTRTNENTISGKYIIGDTDSNQDTSNLTITDVTMTSIYDTADNQQTSSTVPGGTDNVSHKGIIIDTTAPEGALRIDRSIGKVYAQVTDSNGMSTANMQMQYAALAQHTDVCTYGEFQAFASEFALTETASLAQKVCAKFKDEAGNISLAAISVTPETPQNVQYTDLTNANIDPNYKGMFISWQMPTTEEGTLGFLQYELQWCHDNKDSAECTPTSQSDGTITDISHNYFTHNNMEDEKYCYRLRFKDKNQDYSKFSDKHCVIPGENMIATDSETAITNVAVGAETNSGAQVSFTTVNAKNNLNTPLATRATLTVYDNSALADTNQVAQIVDKDYNVNHVIKITGLTKPSTQYYFKLEATDASIETNPHRTTMLAYEATTHPELTFTTLGALSIITLINDSVTTDSKAVIEFKTDQNAKCFIHYWTMAGTVINDNGTTGLEGEYKKNHTVTITDLLFPDTSYSYTISCSDADNATVTLDNDFKTSNKTLSQSDVTVTAGDTTAPEISGVAISALKGESASITWNTNEKANSLVAYELEGATYTMMAGDYAVNVSASTYSTAHSVMINNLIPATKYNFSVISSDASGNIAQSSQSAFTTSEPSSLSSVKVISKALNQATFSWQTGSDTTSIVEYGLTTAYGETKKSQASTKVHELTIADLKAGSTYHFRVKGADAQGNLFASNDSTFEPKSPPKIADFKVDEITEHGAKLTFTTNVPTDTLVAFTDADKEENSGVQGKSEFATKHELVLKNLASGVTFGLNLKVRDEDGNETEETFPSFQTSKDENAPKIDQIKTSSALSQTDKVQSIISWLTDEGATSTLAYREGRDGNDTTVNASDKLATNHISVITSFKPGTVYYFRVKAKDEAGNESTSTEYAILTPRRKENIIQIILANFQDIFKWAQK